MNGHASNHIQEGGHGKERLQRVKRDRRKRGNTPNDGFFKLDLPEIAEWDRLLRQLGLHDPQAREAVKSDGGAWREAL